ncbi:doxx family protein [Aureivirga sp. CE67]|uniref:doxx family protein n=1 Tax=Aureivirga sp. CE67 TaxID=1788983 RepID=UPI0018CAD019|nr:doxx family protein [Aureivirga sp. CE67]
MKTVTDLKTKFLGELYKVNGTKLLRYSIGFIFIWFGALKFFDGMSPAQDLAINTIDKLTFHLFSANSIRYGLAILEVVIGLGMFIPKYLKQTLVLLNIQMLGTLTPIFLFPSIVFTRFPYALSLEGQYIFKNFVIISAAIVIAKTSFKKN